MNNNTEEFRKAFGLRVKVARVEAQMTQLQLSAAIEVDHNMKIDDSSIGFIENGTRHVKIYELEPISKVLNKPILWFLFGNDIPDEQVDFLLG